MSLHPLVLDRQLVDLLPDGQVLVAMIMLRTLHQDIAKYNNLESRGGSGRDGLKLVHAPSVILLLNVIKTGPSL
jgi:hypothetical protein